MKKFTIIYFRKEREGEVYHQKMSRFESTNSSMHGNVLSGDQSEETGEA